MKLKYIKYIINTFLCRYSQYFNIKNSFVRYILYKVQGANNIIKIQDSSVTKSSFSLHGKNNSIGFYNSANMYYTNINIVGNNNQVSLNGCSGILSLTLRGDYCKVIIGKDSTMEDCYMVCMGQKNSITIGNDCMFSGKVEIWNSDTHLITDMEGNSINPSKPISIGNHVWLGKGVKILKGVTIGHNSVIGMGSIVTKHIMDNSIAAGNPAKTIKNNVKWEKGFIKI